MSFYNWNLVATPAPTYYTYILQPPLIPVTVGLPTLQPQISTLPFLQQNQLPQDTCANIVNHNLLNVPRDIAPKPALTRIEESSDANVIKIKEESENGDEDSSSVVKDEVEAVKFCVKEELQIKEEKDPLDEIEDGLKKKCKVKKPRSVKDFNCAHCPYTTTWKGNLTKHVISKHTSLDQIKWLKCEHCSYQGKTRDYLKCHLLHVHDIKVKWFDCPNCEFRAKMKCLLDRHTIRNHPEMTEIEWLKCDQCPYQAKFKTNLKEHMLSKHAKLNEISWFHCAHCKFKAKRKRSLRFHLQNKHTPEDRIQWFQCEFCPYRMFKRKAALMKHVGIMHENQEEEESVKIIEPAKKRSKLETKEIPVFIENKLCFKRVVVGTVEDNSFTCPPCHFQSNDKELYKKHILKHHVVTELKKEEDGIVKMSFKTKDVVVMVDDVPCVKRILDHPLS